MAMSFKERTYSQEGLEVMRPSIMGHLFYDRLTGFKPPVHQDTTVSPELAQMTGQNTWSSDSSLEQGNVPRHPRLICGVSITTLLFATIAALAIATAGVLGGLLGTRSTSCPSITSKTSTPPTNTTTPTPSSTASIPVAFTTSQTVPLDCPSLQDQTQTYDATSGHSYTFKFNCNDDCPNNTIVAIWSYSIDMCLDACVSFTDIKAANVTCGAVTFRSVLGNSSEFGGNCFLKTGCPSSLVTDLDEKIASAVLVT